MTVTCGHCGVVYGVGQWYQCPHESMHAGRGADVTWPGGKTFENLGDQPVTFYSPAEKDRYLRTHGIEEFVRHQPVPGSDKSPHTSSWAGMDAQTLANATALLERSGRASNSESPSYVKEFSVTISTVIESVRGSLS